MTEREVLIDGPLHCTAELLAADIAEQYGLDVELAAIGVAWAIDWHAVLQHAIADGTPLSRELVAICRDASAEGLPIPQDETEGRPMFRARCAAQSLECGSNTTRGFVVLLGRSVSMTHFCGGCNSYIADK